MGEFLETYRGEALAWEADDLGHLNMRFYFERIGQSKPVFFSHLDLPDAYKAGSFSTVVVKDQHIKYLAEILPGRGIVVNTAILEIGECDMVLVHMIMASPDTLSATIIEKVSHNSRRTKLPFSWSTKVRNAAQKYIVDMPALAAPRNIDPLEKSMEPSLAKATKLDLLPIGIGAFLPTECDVFGYIRPYNVIGRVSDSVQHLTAAWPDVEFTGQHQTSGALLEARVLHHHIPVAGDSYVIYSGLRRADSYVRDICHWILDPISGKCWSSMIGASCKFDLKLRRMIKNDAKTLKMLEPFFAKGLGI